MTPVDNQKLLSQDRKAEATPCRSWGRVSDLGETGLPAGGGSQVTWLCQDGVVIASDSSPSGAGAILELQFGEFKVNLWIYLI